MSRDEVTRFGLEAAKDEYARGQARLGLVETKASLIAVTVGTLLALLAALADHLPHVWAGAAFLWLATVGALLVSLILSLAASVLVEVRTPRGAREVCAECETLIRDIGQVDVAVDGAAAERLVGNTCGTYLAAAQAVAVLLADRTVKLKVAQIALIAAIVFMVVLIGGPYAAEAVELLSGGG
jgi:hypothetical protein